MLIVGLTGNIGCGKSTVAQMLAKFPDTAVVDCDRLAKDIYTSPNFRPTVEAILGTDIWKDGQLDIKSMAAIFFRDPEIKRRLQAVMFPLVFQELTRLEDEARQTGKKLFVVESAILFESNLDKRWKPDEFVSIAVTCPSEEQRRRLKANRGMTDEQIDERLRHQISADLKAKRSTVVLHSDCDLTELETRVGNLHEFLRLCEARVLHMG